MRNIELKAFARARVWEGELPNARYAGESVCRELGYANSSLPGYRGAIEAFVPRGAMAEYALLGGEFRPDHSGRLTLSVLSNGGKGKIFESLAARIDEVRIGLPHEFVEAVLNVSGFGSHMPSGLIEINCAAHGRVGSNAHLFGRVASLLLAMLCGAKLTDEEIQYRIL